MTMFSADFFLVVVLGMVVRVSKVWYIVEMFVSPALDPRWAKNCFALAAGLVSQWSRISSLTMVYVGDDFSSKNRAMTFQQGGGRHSMTSSAFLFSLEIARILKIISARKNQALGSFVSKVPMLRGFSEVAEAEAETEVSSPAGGAAGAALVSVIFAGSPV